MKVGKLKRLLEHIDDDKDIVVNYPYPYGNDMIIIKVEDEDEDAAIIRVTDAN